MNKDLDRQTGAEEMEEAPIIKFPDDLPSQDRIERTRGLWKKLNEYEERILKYRAEQPFFAPIRFQLGIGTPTRATELYARQFVLEKFLENTEGQVNTFELSQEYAKTLGISGFDQKLQECWDRACRVVEDYVITGGQNAMGGTGLK